MPEHAVFRALFPAAILGGRLKRVCTSRIIRTLTSYGMTRAQAAELYGSLSDEIDRIIRRPRQLLQTLVHWNRHDEGGPSSLSVVPDPTNALRSTNPLRGNR